MKLTKDNKEKLDNLLNKYSLSQKDKKEFKKMVLPIIKHNEFQKRMNNPFYHHGNITLGEHIIEDSIVTYMLSKKKKENYRTDLALKISMFHDLYTVPWQNNKEAKVQHFFHKHGFRHPIEGVINAMNWYPEYFEDIHESEIIIDGILHHMFPLPVLSSRIIDDKLELKNYVMYYNIPSDYQNIIINSLKRKKLGAISISRSKYLEGKTMAKADRIVSRKEIRNFSSMKALLTGHNKKLNK